MNTERAARIAWVDAETLYQNAKRPDRAGNDASMQGGVKDNDYYNDMMMYVHRAHILGLDNPLGRQALAKGMMVYTEWVDATIRVFGDLPPGGVASGETGRSNDEQ